MPFRLTKDICKCVTSSSSLSLSSHWCLHAQWCRTIDAGPLVLSFITWKWENDRDSWANKRWKPANASCPYLQLSHYEVQPVPNILLGGNVQCRTRSNPWDPAASTQWCILSPCSTLSLKSDFLGFSFPAKWKSILHCSRLCCSEKSKATPLYHSRSVFPRLNAVCDQWSF